jgi:three-Cys-motif partner protein
VTSADSDSGPPAGVTWEIEPHTLVKHELLREYLKRWLPIIGSWSPGMNYVDGFAGPGQYLGGEEGSPIIAIREAMGHKIPPKGRVHFIFIERNPIRATHLKALLEQRFPAASLPKGWVYSVETNEFEESVGKAVDGIEKRGANLAPTLAFVDPFGFAGLPMSTIRRVLSFPHCEVFVTLMTGFITRFLEDDRSDTLDGLFGSKAWRNLRGLSGDPRTRGILALYESGLKSVAGAKFVRTFEIQNDVGRVLYHLVFATNHSRGLEEMKEAMWTVDRRGTFVFSDLTGLNQRFLLDYSKDDEPHWLAEAADQVYHQFAGRSVNEAEVHEWVASVPAFVYRKQILKKLEKEGRITGAGPRARAGTYPEGCVIQFAPRAANPLQGN